jgi:hypothetical protein
VHKRSFLLDLDKPNVLSYELSIKNFANDCRHDWREFQRIKNELCGPNFEACELYPSEERLVDTANQFYIFCLPEGLTFPFGFPNRLVLDADEGPKIKGTNQRAFSTEMRPLASMSPSLRKSSLAEEIRHLRSIEESLHHGDDHHAETENCSAQTAEKGQEEDR